MNERICRYIKPELEKEGDESFTIDEFTKVFNDVVYEYFGLKMFMSDCDREEARDIIEFRLKKMREKEVK